MLRRFNTVLFAGTALIVASQAAAQPEPRMMRDDIAAPAGDTMRHRANARASAGNADVHRQARADRREARQAQANMPRPTVRNQPAEVRPPTARNAVRENPRGEARPDWRGRSGGDDGRSARDNRNRPENIVRSRPSDGAPARSERESRGSGWNQRDSDRSGNVRVWDGNRRDNRPEPQGRDRNDDRRQGWNDRDRDRDRDRDYSRERDRDRDYSRDRDRQDRYDRDRRRDNDRNWNGHGQRHDPWRYWKRARPTYVIVRPSTNYYYRPHWWGSSYYLFDNRYDRYGYDYGAYYRPGLGYYGSLRGDGWSRLYPWLRDDHAARHWVMWNFDDNRNGRLGKDEARDANRAFDRLADRNRDGYVSSGEARWAIEELRDEYRYSYRMGY